MPSTGVLALLPRLSLLEWFYDAYASGACHFFITFVHCKAEAKDLPKGLVIKLTKQDLPTQIDNEKPRIWRLAHHLTVDWQRRKTSRDSALEA